MVRVIALPASGRSPGLSTASVTARARTDTANRASARARPAAARRRCRPERDPARCARRRSPGRPVASCPAAAVCQYPARSDHSAAYNSRRGIASISSRVGNCDNAPGVFSWATTRERSQVGLVLSELTAGLLDLPAPGHVFSRVEEEYVELRPPRARCGEAAVRHVRLTIKVSRGGSRTATYCRRSAGKSANSRA